MIKLKYLMLTLVLALATIGFAQPIGSYKDLPEGDYGKYTETIDRIVPILETVPYVDRVEIVPSDRNVSVWIWTTREAFWLLPGELDRHLTSHGLSVAKPWDQVFDPLIGVYNFSDLPLYVWFGATFDRGINPQIYKVSFPETL